MFSFDEQIEHLTHLAESYRVRLFRPILALLTRLHISPNLISSSKIIIGLAGLYVIQSSPRLAFFIFLLTFPMDLLDGSLARYQAKASDRGKFIDMLTDQMSYCLIVFSLITVNFADQSLLAYSLFILPTLYLLVIIRRNESKLTDWIIRPVARISYYKSVIYAFASLALFRWISISAFEIILAIVNILITVHFVCSYTAIFNQKHA